MSYRIATLNKISPKGLALFGSDYEVADGLSSPDAILVRSAQLDTDTYPGLLAVARAGAGVNNITVDKAAAAGVCVFNTPGANANAVAELVFAAMGAGVRNILAGIAFAKATADTVETDKDLDAAMEKGKSKFAGSELAGKTLGVIGLGKIGILVANLGIKHGMDVVAFDPFPSIDNIHQLAPEAKMVKSMAEVAAAADLLTVHIPLMDATRGTVDAAFLANMKDGAILVNYSRGPIVKEADVIAALDAGKLAKYLCDFPSKALVKHAKVTCTPHLGASTEESEENCATMAVAELKGYLTLGNVVNSVNFPAVELAPAAGTKARLAVVLKPVADAMASVNSALSAAGISASAIAAKSGKKAGYALVDVAGDLSQAAVDAVAKSADVIRTRVIRF